MGFSLQQRAKDLFNPKEIFHFFTLTLLSLLLPLSFLLLARFSDAQYLLQSLTWFQYSPNPFPYVLTLALNINPFILYILVSIISIASLIHILSGKIITLLRKPSSSRNGVQPCLYIAWILLCSFQVCVGLGIEGSIVAGVYDSDSSFGVERSVLSRGVFLLGLHETTQVWCRMVVRPVVDDTVFGGVVREERWVERVGLALSLGTLWWWSLREDVETLVVMVEAKKEQLMDVRMSDLVGLWLYYLTVAIGMVKVVKGLVWMAMCRRARRRATTVEPSDHDDKV
ncbi:hypothetical protein RJT34_19322 [Clitoria ternatea]|uniref:Transmembrane protein n=1 Tax=Clitoria ternatea TaxID=43366 RepID=A0AAN9IR96_CLITE